MNPNEKKILSYLGLASRAGKIFSGEFSTEKAIKDGSAALVVVAEDASDNTRKNFTDACNYRNVPLVIMFDKISLGHAIGKEMRASLALCDQGFAGAIKKCLGDGGNTY